MKSHDFQDFNQRETGPRDDAPVALPDLAGRVIMTAELVHGTESGELVLLLGGDWHATIHRNENEEGAAYLSVAFFGTPRMSASARYPAVTQIHELEAVQIVRAENIRFLGASAVAIYDEEDHRVLFIAGSEGGTIDIDGLDHVRPADDGATDPTPGSAH